MREGELRTRAKVENAEIDSPVAAAAELVLAMEPDMVDDIILDAILDAETPVLTGAAPPPVAPLLLLLAVEVDETAQEADVGRVTPSLSRKQVSSLEADDSFTYHAEGIRTQRKAGLQIVLSLLRFQRQLLEKSNLKSSGKGLPF